MDDFAKRCAALSPEQRRLLALRLKKKGVQALPVSEPAMPVPPAQDTPAPHRTDSAVVAYPAPVDPMRFGLYFFSDNGSTESAHKYDLVLESARFADAHGFTAIWTPERHFQDFGGLYPNPSVLGAALAVSTQRLQIRAGSVALPLHHPIRIAEDWSVVDNLSNGRAGVSFASGWHPNDFAIAPAAYEDRKAIMFEHIELIRRLWAGELVAFPGPLGQPIEVKLLPRPLQRELPIWITSSGSPATWVQAGAIGAHILTSFNERIADFIRLYRDSRAQHGYDPQQGQVVVMLHTFVGTNNDQIKEQVRWPLSRYLRTFIAQTENTALDLRRNASNIAEADMEAVVAFAFERYFQTSSLIGTPDKCMQMIDQLHRLGVNEIACLVDFGLEHELVVQGLAPLHALKVQYEQRFEQRVAVTSA